MMVSRQKEEEEKKAAQEVVSAKTAKVDPKKQPPAKPGALAQVISTPDPINEKKDQEDAK